MVVMIMMITVKISALMKKCHFIIQIIVTVIEPIFLFQPEEIWNWANH